MALVNQDLVLDVVPGPIPPILHLTEYDENMEVVVKLQRRGQPFQIPTGTTVKVEGTLKGHPFSENGTPSGNTVTFTVSKNMTAYSGRAWTKIKLTKDSKPVSTCGFWLDCDRAGVEADTVIGAPGFEEQIADAAAEWMEQQGFTSPTVSITPITGGNRVTFTDAEHPQGQSIDVMNGQDGGEVDPTLSVEGEAADAFAVGTKFAEQFGMTYLSDNLVPSGGWEKNTDIDDSGAVVDSVNMSLSPFMPVLPDTVYGYLKAKQTEGESEAVEVDALDGVTWTDGIAFDDNGNQLDRPTLSASDYIAVVPGTTYTYKKPVSGGTDAYGMGIYEYSSSKAWVSRDATAGTQSGSNYEKVFTCPAGVYFVRLMAYVDATANAQFVYTEAQEGSAITTDANGMNVYFFDADREFLSGNRNAGNTLTTVGFVKSVQTPSTAAFVRIQSYNYMIAYAIFTRKYSDSDTAFDRGFSSVSVEYVYPQAIPESESLVASTFIWKANGDGGRKFGALPISTINANGVITYVGGNATTNLTSLIRVPASTAFRMKTDATTPNFVVEYGKNKEVLRSATLEASPTGWVNYQTSDDCYYVRVMYRNTNLTPINFAFMPAQDIVFDTVSNVAMPLSSGGTGFAIVPDGYTGTAIQAAIDAAVSVGGGVVQLEPNATYTLTSPITLYSDFVSMLGYGAKIDASALTNTHAIKIVGAGMPTEQEQIRQQYLHVLDGVYLIGANRTANYEGGRNGTGVLFSGTDLTHIAQGFTLSNCTIAGFEIGVDVQSQAWCNTMLKCDISVCDIGLRVPSGYQNYGEKITVLDGCIHTNSIGIQVNHQYATVQCVSVAMDANFCAVICQAGKVIFNQCHFECEKDKAWWIEASGGKILVRDSIFYGQQTNYGLVKITSGKVIIRDCMKETWSMPANNITGGTFEETWI